MDIEQTLPNPKTINRFALLMLCLVAMPVIGGFAFFLLSDFNKLKVASPRYLHEFELTNQFGKEVTLKSFQGKVWVANFIFTRCAAQCPMVNEKMRALQRSFQGVSHFKLASFSVDPEHDTTSVLLEYSRPYDSGLGEWQFLTGKRSELKRVLEQDFQVVGPGDSEGALLTHSDRIVLIDKNGRIYGHYDALNDPQDYKKLYRDAHKLLSQRF